MSLLSDLGTKIGTKLKELQTAINGKLDTTAKAADSNLLDGIDSSRIVYGENESATVRATDFDAINKSGFYDGDATLNGNPFGNWAWVIHNEHGHNNGYGFQLAVKNNTPNDVRVRTKGANVWTDWVSLGGSGTGSVFGQLYCNTTANTRTIMTGSNSGYIEPLQNNASGDTAWFSISGNKLNITKSGSLFISYNQDIISGGTTGYVTTRVYKNGSVMASQLITNTNGQWDGVHNAWSGSVSAGDYIQIYFSAASISSWDYSTWSNYNFMWFN